MSHSKFLAAVGMGHDSDHAIIEAHRYAQVARGELLVCHAIPNALGGYPFFYPSGPVFHVEAAETRERLLIELSAHVGRLTGRKLGEYRVEIRQGRSHEVILRLADEWRADLIFLGISGDEREAAAGPDVRHVLRYAEVPVWIARNPSGTKRILVGTDFSDPALPAVAAAAEESRRTGGEVTILHSIELTTATPAWSALGPIAVELPQAVFDELKTDVEKRLGDALARHGIVGTRRVAHGSPVLALLSAARESSADLIVLGTLGRTGLPRLLVGSVAETVALSAPCSVLVVRLSHSSGATSVR